MYKRVPVAPHSLHHLILLVSSFFFFNLSHSIRYVVLSLCGFTWCVLSCSVASNFLGPDGLQPVRLLCPWGFSREEHWSGLPCPPPGCIAGLLYCRQILYHLSHQGSPGILERVAYPFSRGSSWPRNWTGVSYIAGGFFTSWATREAQGHWSG